MKVNKCICDRCHKEYTPILKETNKYKYRVSATEGKLHLMDVCPDCLADLERFMDNQAYVGIDLSHVDTFDDNCEAVAPDVKIEC